MRITHQSADNKQINRRFESMLDMYNYTRALDGVRTNPRMKTSEAENREKTWDNGQSFAAACRTIEQGGKWEEGAKELQSVDIHTLADSVGDALEPALVLGAVGGAVDIGEYLADNPECFMSIEEIEHQRPIIRIAAVSVHAARTTASAIMNRGRAILAAIEAMERKGYSVELSATQTYASGDTFGSYETVIKQAGEAWSATTAAYPLAHPAFARRLGFRLLETEHEAITHELGTSYGNAHCSRKLGNLTGADVYLPNLIGDSGYETPAAALESIMQEIAQQQPQITAQ